MAKMYPQWYGSQFLGEFLELDGVDPILLTTFKNVYNLLIYSSVGKNIVIKVMEQLSQL